jgi:hypothetical protein
MEGKATIAAKPQFSSSLEIKKRSETPNQYLDSVDV